MPKIPAISSTLPPPPPPPPPPPLPYPHIQVPVQQDGEVSLTDLLLSTTSAATTRNEEAILLFQNIACVLDDAMNGSNLPQHLQQPFREFVADINTVARRHFERHVRGSRRSPPPYIVAGGLQEAPKSHDTLQKSTGSTQTRLDPTLPFQRSMQSPPTATPIQKVPQRYTFAAAVKAVAQRQPTPPARPTSLNRKNNAKKREISDDNRLLVRVTAGHPILSMSPYAIMLELNSFLGEKLVREVQTTRTGFAICPISTAAQEALIARMIEIENHLCSRGSCKVEKAEQHIAYRLSGVPRTYAGYNGTSIELIEITAAVVAEALRDLTHIAPINVLESRGTFESEFADTKSWIVLYPKGSKLSWSLPLFGVRVRTKYLPRRMKTPQCSKCFGWHNE
ncbi:hypothetical protein K3495_g4534 [Podosphaera aphanis]|nr:hypothetical protein K3495_g4534 [Podosphaera aphanis]